MRGGVVEGLQPNPLPHPELVEGSIPQPFPARLSSFDGLRMEFFARVHLFID
jgi:hypothetical protein